MTQTVWAPRTPARMLLAAALAVACQGAREGSDDARIYRVRGVVRQLPAGPSVPLLIEHEAIPDLVDAKGKPAPMRAMTMPFATAHEVDLSGLSVGDPVALTLVVDWSAPSAMLITTIEPLPADTLLELPSRAEAGTEGIGRH